MRTESNLMLLLQWLSLLLLFSIHAFIAFNFSSVIELVAPAHMSGTPSTLSSHTFTITYPCLSIIDGHYDLSKSTKWQPLPPPSPCMMHFTFSAFSPTFYPSMVSLVPWLCCHILPISSYLPRHVYHREDWL